MKFFRLKTSEGAEVGPLIADAREVMAVLDKNEGDQVRSVLLISLHQVAVDGLTSEEVVKQLEERDAERQQYEFDNSPEVQHAKEQQKILSEYIQQLPVLLQSLSKDRLVELSEIPLGDETPSAAPVKKDARAERQRVAIAETKAKAKEKRLALGARLKSKKK